MGKKNIDKLINEELKRFRQLNEYDFYIGDEYQDDNDTEENVVLDEDDDDLGIDELPPDDSKTSNNGDANVDDELSGEEVDTDDELSDEEVDTDDIELGQDEDSDGEIEIDITDLVNKTEEVEKTAKVANEKIDKLVNMIDTLEDKLDTMDKITNKISELENEIEKRVPTPEEKLEMRSLDSYPYNLKLTDFWSEKEGKYDIIDSENSDEEYVLTNDDINSEYSESEVRNSFDVGNEYEEEDV